MPPELHRALFILHLVGRQYPKAWEIHNEFRTLHIQGSDWPEYVFAPRQAARHVVAGGDARTHRQVEAIELVGTLAAWRPTQGIYRVDEALLDAVWATPVTGDLPGELLRRLPEWCVHIELGRQTPLGLVRGVWARIGFDANTREEELDLLLDMDDRPRTIRLPLVGNLEDSLRVSFRDARNHSNLNVATAEAAHVQLRATAEPILSIVLYLCSVNAEMVSPRGDRPKRPTPRRLKTGEQRWPAANEPVIWQTGTRLGAALRRGQERLAEPGSEGTGPTLRPHIRRAHWHSFWVGAHDSPDRRRDVRWLPPIAVNLEPDAVPDVATVRPVPASDDDDPGR